MAIDGVILDVPDTPENNEEFEHSSGGKGDSAFPLVRMVALAECGTHAIVAAELGTWSTGERTLVTRLVPDLDPDMLVVMDRGFYSYKLWHAILDQGAAMVFRASSRMVLPVLEAYPDGSYRSVLLDPKRQSPIRKRAARAGDAAHAVLESVGTPCRVVEYMVTNRNHDTETFCLITSILNHEEAPAHALAELYHERWEIENLFDEIEIHQIGGDRVLRSKSPEMIRQEIWAILLTHYAIRHLMSEAADHADHDSDRLSFIRSLRIIRRQITRQADFPPSTNA